MNLQPWKVAYEPDNGGAGGDPDAGDPDGTPPDAGAKAKPTSNNDALKAVADSIREAITAARVPVTAPPPVQSGPDASLQAAIAREADTVNARVDELFAAGKAAEAMNERDAFIRKVNAATASNPNDNVIVKTALDLGERMARNEHADVMKRWGDEVRRAVDALPVEERIRPNAWDRAVRDVRSNHFDELLNETVTAKVEEARKSFVPPPGAGGSRGARPSSGPAAHLTEEQLWGADVAGVSPDEYAKVLAREEAFDKLPFKERAKFPGYPVLDDPRGNARVQPGKF